MIVFNYDRKCGGSMSNFRTLMIFVLEFFGLLSYNINNFFPKKTGILWKRKSKNIPTVHNQGKKVTVNVFRRYNPGGCKPVGIIISLWYCSPGNLGNRFKNLYPWLTAPLWQVFVQPICTTYKSNLKKHQSKNYFQRFRILNQFDLRCWPE